MNTKRDIGLLILRLVFGLTFAAHGAQKLFGWFGGYGLAGTAKFLETLGMKPGSLFALMAGLGEVVGGLLLAFGLWTWVGAGLIAITMLVAIVTVTGPKGYWATKGGAEYTVAILTAAIAVALTGPGNLTLASLMGRKEQSKAQA